MRQAEHPRAHVGGTRSNSTRTGTHLRRTPRTSVLVVVLILDARALAACTRQTARKTGVHSNIMPLANCARMSPAPWGVVQITFALRWCLRR